VIVLNVDASRLDVLGPLRLLLNAGLRVPIVVTGTRCPVECRIEALRAGADDFVALPATGAEIFARIEAVLRRGQLPADQEERRLRLGTLRLDLVERRVSNLTHTVLLTVTECRILALLMRNTGMVLTRMMILERIWGYHFSLGTNTVDVHIGKLCKRLGVIGANRSMLKTVRGRGYVIG
jgi:two-component system OmpR family response regulator